MQQLLNFVIKNKTFLLFSFLFGVALALTIQSHSYHRSSFINSSNSISGGIYGFANSVSSYLGLKKQNEILLDENKYLRSLLFYTESNIDSVYIDSTSFRSPYRIMKAQVYKNSYGLSNNYLTLNKGEVSGVKTEFGVITSKGILGIIDKTSNKYSRVLSILNQKSSVNAKLKQSNHYGSLVWDAKSPQNIKLKDISRFAPVNVGDTIVTGGQSAIFPEGINIGHITDFIIDETGDTYTVNVKLFNDMTNIKSVYIIENIDKEEIESLEANSNE